MYEPKQIVSTVAEVREVLGEVLYIGLSLRIREYYPSVLLVNEIHSSSFALWRYLWYGDRNTIINR